MSPEPPSLQSLVTTLPQRLLNELLVDRFRLWLARVDGLEVTQGIQYYKAARHLTDAADRGGDNTARLVAGKPAWVRVYVRSGLFGQVFGVTGRLRVQRRYLGFLWTTVATLDPEPPGSATARSFADYATERGNVANTLNFVVPAASFSGVLRLTVTLIDRTGRTSDTETVTVDATLRQTLRLRAILVSYNGPSTANTVPGQPPPPNLALAAPTLANLQATAGRALRAMPVQATGVFTSAGTRAWNLPLDDPRTGAGGCSNNWNLLLAALTNQRTADGNRPDVVYYGLLPAGIPLNVPGCGQGGLGSAASGDQTTLLHEIGHGYGFQHTPCGAAGATDAAYPTYEPYASASIGEYGLDVSNGNVLSPAATSDYMSYCFPQWMSLYQHARLISHPRLDPRWERDEPWWHEYLEWRDYVIPEHIPDPPPDPWTWAQMRPERLISLTGLVDADGRVQVLTVARVEASPQVEGRTTDLTAQLLGADGAVLAQAPLVRLSTHGGGCGCGCGDEDHSGYAFQAVVADVGRGEVLRIAHEDDERWVRRAPADQPEVSDVDADVDKDGNVELRWRARAGDEPEAWVQRSVDGGRTWQAVATGVQGARLRLEPDVLPPGEVQLRVLVHDGFSTATSDAVTVSVPARPATAAVLHPEEGQTLLAGRTMRLWAAVSGPAGGPPEGATATWTLDGDPVAEGTDEWTAAPAAGEHTVTLTVRSPGGETVSSVSFRTIDADERDGGEDRPTP